MAALPQNAESYGTPILNAFLARTEEQLAQRIRNSLEPHVLAAAKAAVAELEPKIKMHRAFDQDAIHIALLINDPLSTTQRPA